MTETREPAPIARLRRTTDREKLAAALVKAKDDPDVWIRNLAEPLLKRLAWLAKEEGATAAPSLAPRPAP